MEFLKKFDFFPKLSEQVEVKKTSQGGVIFSTFFFIIAALFLIEIFSFFLGDPIKQPFIEKPNLEEKVRININISIHETPCEALSLDLQDITGNSYEDLKHSIYKLDLNEQGYVIDAEKFKETQKFEKKNFFPSYPFWERITGRSKGTSCYGAELYEGQECKTCEDVLRAYRQRRWPAPMIEMITQCRGVQVPKTVNTLPNIQIGLPQGPRLLEQVDSPAKNFTQKPAVLQLFNEQVPQFAFMNSLFVITDMKEHSMFSFSVTRNQCQNPQDASLEFRYIDFVSGETKKVKSDPIFFAGTQCKVYFPFKIDYIKGDELILQSFLIKGERLHIKIQEDDELFKVQVSPLNTNQVQQQQQQNELPTTVFKRGYDFEYEQPSKIPGRMLHAEFYGFNDQRPTFITPYEIEFFKKKMGTGCQIVGTMFIKKVPGNFHISTHHKGLALKFIDQPITARHKIHLLEFTKDDGKITLGSYAKASNFLDGTHLHPPISHDVHYYLKLVGSTYKHLFWGEHKFYEYVAHADVVAHETEQKKNVILVEFKYEFDPVSMRYLSGRSSITHFIVSLLAIIGGIFATSTFIDRISSRFKS